MSIKNIIKYKQMRPNIYKYLLLIMILPTINGRVSIAQNNLTFEDALKLTKQQSHVVKQCKFLKQEKEQEMKAARGTFYPNIGLAGNYVYMSDDLHLDMTPVKDAITPIYKGLSKYGSFSGLPNPGGGVLPDNVSTKFIRQQFAKGLQTIENSDWNTVLQKQQFAVVNLTATLPIYTGGRLNAKRNATKLDMEDADLESKAKINKLTTELVTRYFGLCLSKQLEQISKEVLDAMQKHLSDAEKMQEKGMIAKAEVLHAKVYHSEAERKLKKTERMIKISNKALITTLNDSVERSIYPISKLFYLDELEPIEYFEQKAQENNPSLKRVESKKELAKIGVKVKTAGYLPTVVALGNYDVWDYDLSEHTPKWTVGVGLKWTLFDGLSREREHKSAKLKLSQVNEFEQKISKDIKTGVEKYYQEIQMQIEQIKELETAQEFADEYYRVREKAFHEGMASSTDVVDANLALVKVKTEKLQAAYQFDISLAKLLEICGMSDDFIQYQTSAKAKTETFNK